MRAVSHAQGGTKVRGQREGTALTVSGHSYPAPLDFPKLAGWMARRLLCGTRVPRPCGGDQPPLALESLQDGEQEASPATRQGKPKQALLSTSSNVGKGKSRLSFD